MTKGTCPKCGYCHEGDGSSAKECPRCGLIYAKFKREPLPQITAVTSPEMKKSRWVWLAVSVVFVAALSVVINNHVKHIGAKNQTRGFQARALKLKSVESFVDETRFALVIGNADYSSAPLNNPANDAELMAQSLRRVGFQVDMRANLGRSEMKRAINSFGRSLKRGGTGLFYYAGHAMQIKGQNYLLPTNENIQSEKDVSYDGIDVNLILNEMLHAKTRVNIVILDACRNNPFTRSTRSAERGLAYMSAPAGTFIAYATSPGSVASDGAGGNSIYSEKLAEYVQIPGLKIEDVFKDIRVAVNDKTAGHQTPWESTSLMGDFYFCPEHLDIRPEKPSPVHLAEKTDPAPVKMPVKKVVRADEDMSFELFKSAKANKYEQKFDLARNQLNEALTYLPDGHPDTREIKDELYYHLPLKEAQWYLNKFDDDKASALIDDIKDYIDDHPDRFTLIQEVDHLESALSLLGVRRCVLLQSFAHNTMNSIMNYYANRGEIPAGEDLKKKLHIDDRYPIDIITGEKFQVTLRVKNEDDRCNLGQYYVMSRPAKSTDGWQ